MSRKYQCQRTEPHPSHEWVLHIKDWENCGCPILDCEGVNFVEFKVGDKVRTKVFEVTTVRESGSNRLNSVMGFISPNNSGRFEYAFHPDALELVERPEPPLPDWLTNPKPQESFITLQGNVIIWSGKNWINAVSHIIISPLSIEPWYRRGEIKRLVPES
jgi:hypothetical protein